MPQYGTSPLQAAIENNHTETAQMLIDKGAKREFFEVVIPCIYNYIR